MATEYLDGNIPSCHVDSDVGGIYTTVNTQTPSYQKWLDEVRQRMIKEERVRRREMMENPFFAFINWTFRTNWYKAYREERTAYGAFL